MNEAAHSEGMALLALVRKSLRASANFSRVIREQSVLKMMVIGAVGALLVGGMGYVFYRGFDFMATLGGAGLMIVQNLFALFFLGLGLMLVFSSAVTAYSAIFRAEEMNFLILRPMPVGQVLIHKYWEVALLSSWAFFFMVIPFIAAYAVFQKLSPLFAVWTILYAVPFVLICAAVGTIVAMLIVRWVPKGRWLWITLALILVAMVARFVLQTVHEAKHTDDAQLVLSRLVPGMKLSAYPLWPSWWMAEGILSLSRDNPSRGVMLWLLLASTAMMCSVAVEGVGRLTFYESWFRQMPVSSGHRKAVSIRGLEDWLAFLPHDTRAVLVKDIRVFLRDPMQWSQALIFFGLLGIYFMNLRNLRYNLYGEVWRDVICWLNMISVSAVMCSLSARFVFPQMSLEGHSFWILGLSPMSMRRVLRAKFGLAFAALGITGAVLTGISTSMLEMSPVIRGVAQVISLAVAAGMAALATGLGAFFLDLRNRNPVAIISGFGGTLNLVMGLIFIFASILPFAILSHSFISGGVGIRSYRLWIGGLILYLTAITMIATFVPLYLGRRSLSQREY